MDQHDDSYDGCANYETFVVNRWLTSNEEMCRQCRELAAIATVAAGFTALAKRSCVGAFTCAAAAGCAAARGAAFGEIEPLVPDMVRGAWATSLPSDRFPNMMDYFPIFRVENFENKPALALGGGARPVNN